jgi:hypothetical protein
MICDKCDHASWHIDGQEVYYCESHQARMREATPVEYADANEACTFWIGEDHRPENPRVTELVRKRNTLTDHQQKYIKGLVVNTSASKANVGGQEFIQGVNFIVTEVERLYAKNLEKLNEDDVKR